MPDYNNKKVISVLISMSLCCGPSSLMAWLPKAKYIIANRNTVSPYIVNALFTLDILCLNSFPYRNLSLFFPPSIIQINIFFSFCLFGNSHTAGVYNSLKQLYHFPS